MLSKAKFTLSKSKVFEKYAEVKKLADYVSYSYKTNFEVGKILKNSDCFFSVHSLESVKQLNCPKRIWFFAQAWDKEEINVLLKEGINKFVVDNESDLEKLLTTIEKRQEKIHLLLRMRLKEHTIHTGKHFVYGMYSKEINKHLPYLKKNKKIEKLGLHFHRKTQNISEWSLKEELIECIDEENWSKIDLINMGGGIPSEYKNFRSNVLINIFNSISEFKAWINKKNIKTIIEPGRYIASYPVKLEANIKSIYDNNIIIDCSVYNAAMDTFVANIRLLVEGEVTEEEGQAYTIKGCTPDSMDIFRYRVYLKKPKIGDKVVFLNAGAYNYSSDFCNLPKLDTIVID